MTNGSLSNNPTRKGKTFRVGPPRKRINFLAYALIAPALISFLLFLAYPLLRTLVGSFYEFGLVETTNRFVGMANFVELSGDPVFWIALRNNMIILIGSVIIQVGLGVILAAILNRGVRRASGLFQLIIFAPMVMSGAAVGLLWQLVYEPSVGILNQILRVFGIPTPMLGWLGDPNIAIYAVLFVACWQYTGFMMVMLLAGMQSVPPELYEAAKIDGANEIQSFRYITIPGIRNVLIAAILITAIGAFKAFDIIYVLTLGGPANASQVLGGYLYKNAFTLDRMGYASAIAVVLLCITLALGLLQLRLARTDARGAP